MIRLPKTSRDWVCFILIVVNAISIVSYGIASAVIFSPSYVGISIAFWMAIIELSILWLIKYREDNFNPWVDPIAIL